MIKKLFAAALILFAALSCGDKNKEKTEGDFSKQTNWNAAISMVYLSGTTGHVKLALTAPGSTYMSVDIIIDGELDPAYGDGSLEEIAAAVKQGVDNQLAKYSIKEVLWTEKETVDLAYPHAGPAHVYIFDFDEYGALTGKYAIVDITLPEPPGGEDTEEDGTITGTVSLQSNWSASLDGSVISDEDGDFIYLNVSTPGATYFWCDTYTADELSAYYEGSVRNMLLDYSAHAKAALAEGYYGMDDLYWVAGAGEDVWMDVYGPGSTYIYIIDLDAEGNATGKYGKSAVTIPEYESADGSAAPLRVKVRRRPGGLKNLR